MRSNHCFIFDYNFSKFSIIKAYNWQGPLNSDVTTAITME